ncbi:MAG: serine hydrolase [Fibrobacteria bacterium]|nr:serine hydrolase [Fibrobacteria bacterium]
MYKTKLILSRLWTMLLITCLSVTYSVAQIWPDSTWETDSAEVQGMSTEKLQAYIDWLDGKASAEPYGTIIIRSGKIVAEYYGGGATASSKWEIGSLRKAVGSTLLGMALDDSIIALDDIVYDIWPAIDKGKSRDKRIKVKHLFNSTSGWMQGDEPGSKWVYCNACFTASGEVVGAAFEADNNKIAPLAEEKIGDAIGALNWHAYHYDDPFSGAYSNPGPKLAVDSDMRDLARFGYLWLRKGNWNGKQLVPEWYIEEASHNTVSHLGKHYGYCWFVNDNKVLLPDAPNDVFFHIGNGTGNRRTVLLIIPSQDIVAAVGVKSDAWDINKDYKSEPVPNVNEWISQIMPSILSDPVAIHKSNHNVVKKQEIQILNVSSISSSVLSVQLSMAKKQNVNIIVSDVSGKIYSTTSGILEKGMQRKHITLESPVSGIAVVTVITKKNIYKVKVPMLSH